MEAGESRNTSGSVAVKYTDASVDGVFSSCSVTEPIKVHADLEGVENGEEMALESEPGKKADTFTEITLEGCVAAGTYPVKGHGKGRGTRRNGNRIFEPASESLTLGGSKAEFESTDKQDEGRRPRRPNYRRSSFRRRR